MPDFASVGVRQSALPALPTSVQRSPTPAIQREPAKPALTSSRFEGDATLEAVLQNKQKIGRGQRGNAVKLIQESLLAQSYALPKSGADGKFGPETEKAVMAFQADVGLTADGVVGFATMKELDARDFHDARAEAASLALDTQSSPSKGDPQKAAAEERAARRGLTDTEKQYAYPIFLDSIDYSRIVITRDSVYSTGAPKTIGNTIHLRSDSDWGHFEKQGESLTMKLTAEGLNTLVHEMGHVWQYQVGGLDYIPASLWAQAKAWAKSGDRNQAYKWEEAHQAGLDWAKWNPEQQAEAIEAFDSALRRFKANKASLADIKKLRTLKPYMDMVRDGKGAP